MATTPASSRRRFQAGAWAGSKEMPGGWRSGRGWLLTPRGTIAGRSDARLVFVEVGVEMRVFVGVAFAILIGVVGIDVRHRVRAFRGSGSLVAIGLGNCVAAPFLIGLAGIVTPRIFPLGSRHGARVRPRSKRTGPSGARRS